MFNNEILKLSWFTSHQSSRQTTFEFLQRSTSNPKKILVTLQCFLFKLFKLTYQGFHESFRVNKTARKLISSSLRYFLNSNKLKKRSSTIQRRIQKDSSVSFVAYFMNLLILIIFSPN